MHRSSAAKGGRAETKLRESDSDHQGPASKSVAQLDKPTLAVLQRSPIGMLIYQDGRLVHANPAVAQLHGVSEQDEPRLLDELLDRLRSDADLAGALSDEAVGTIGDYAWRSKDDTETWIQVFASPVLWNDAPARQIWLTDITRQKDAHNELLRSRDQMAAAQRLTHIGNWEWHLRTGRCLWSDELYCIHGREPESYQPTPFNEDCLHPEDAELVKDRLELCRMSGTPATFEYRVIRPSGEERIIEVHVSVTPDEEGKPLILTGAVNDVTRDEVIRDQLESEKGKAERANRAKSEFMANMSHELRTPLNAIIGFSEVMRREMFGAMGDGRYRDYAASIYESGDHLLRLINDILDLSKVEAGKYRLNEEAVEVPKVIEYSLNTFTVLLERKGLSLVRSIPENLPRLLADKRVLQQILLNLLSNAVKFTEQGSVMVEVTMPRGFLITIQDTGMGMAEHDIARAFEPFEQIESSASLSHEGTGIGLTLTKRLMEAHGGELRLTSEPGAGTKVEADFPESRILW